MLHAAAGLYAAGAIGCRGHRSFGAGQCAGSNDRHITGLGHRLDLGTENASGLSVGEQQRLALVRLILARPDWVFLDEATSALDPETERLMTRLLRSELPDTTFVIVAHREPQGLASVRNVSLGQVATYSEGQRVHDRNTVPKSGSIRGKLPSNFKRPNGDGAP